MTRTAASLPFLITLGCTVGPNFVGETAETGDSVGAGEGTDGGDTEGGDTSSGAGDCRLDCPPGVMWMVPAGYEPNGATFHADGRIHLHVDDPHLGDYTEAQAFSRDGAALGAPFTLGLMPNGDINDLAERDQSVALLYLVEEDDYSKYHLALVPDDLESTTWSVEYATTGETIAALHVAFVADGSLRVVGFEAIDGALVMFVHAYTSAGELAWTWVDDTPDPGGVAHIVDDPQGNSVTIWDEWFDEEQSSLELVRIDGTGDELGRVVLHMPGHGTRDIVRRGGRWTAVGQRTKDDGIWLADIDDSLALGSPIEDDDDMFVQPWEALAYDGGVLVFASEYSAHPSTGQVRRYAADGALEDVIELPFVVPGPEAQVDIDAALSPTGDLIVWGTEILEADGAEPPGVGWLARVVP